MVKSNKDSLVSIIVTNYNGLKYLKRCFDSLLHQTYKNIELIFADDCSTDGSVAYMKKHYPMVKLAVNKRNSGLSVNSNNGAKVASGKYYFFYNNDTYSYPNFIEELVKAAEVDELAGVVCPMQLPYYKSQDKDMAFFWKDRASGSDMYGYVCLSMLSGHTFFPDAAIFMRADAFKKVRGFDNDFFLYGEDMDLCWRVHLMGYKFVFATKAKFRHDSNCVQKENGRIVTNVKRRYFVERQTINKLFKYYSLPTLVWVLPSFFLFYACEALVFLIFRLDVRVFWNVYVKAIIWNFQKRHHIIKNRRYIQSIRKMNDRYMLSIMYPGYCKLRAARILGLPVIK